MGDAGAAGNRETSVIAHDLRDTSAPDRNLALELVRVTEAAALAAARWVGRGDKEGADQAAVDAMRFTLHAVPMDGIVVIGEGEKDEAPMLYNGEQIGDASPPEVDVAVDPLEGTRLTALGQPNALSVVALSERSSMFDPGPCVYMEKIAGGVEIADLLHLDRPLGETLRLIAKRRRHDLTEVLDVDRLVTGKDVFFAATGVTDGDLLQGVRYQDGAEATTESLVMRSRSGTVRKVQARHNRLKLRELTGTRYG